MILEGLLGLTINMASPVLATLELGDYAKILPTLPEECAGMIYACPPYGVLGWKWDTTIVPTLLTMWPILRRLLAKGRVMCFLADGPTSRKLQESNPAEFWREQIWVKPQSASVQGALPSREERLVIFVKGGGMPSVFNHIPAVTKPREAYKDVEKRAFSHINSSAKYSGHRCSDGSDGRQTSVIFGPTDKSRRLENSLKHNSPNPSWLAGYETRQFTMEGELVIDPFAGTATSGVGVVEAGRRFFGTEILPHWFEKGKLRLETGLLGGRSFDDAARRTGGFAHPGHDFEALLVAKRKIERLKTRLARQELENFGC